MLTDDLHNRLTVAKQSHGRLLELTVALAEQKAKLKVRQRRHEASEKLSDAKKREVEKLDYGVTGFICWVLGTEAKRLAKARQELLSARLTLKVHRDAVGQTLQEVQRLEQEITALGNVEAEYRRLIDEKNRSLVEAGGENAKVLQELNEREAELRATRDELQGAIEAGHAARRSLHRVQRDLDSATRWGIWDLIGGAFLATLSKHADLRAAKRAAESAHRDILRFQHELAGVDQRLRTKLDGFSGFTSTADYLLDGFLVDLFVQSKIAKAREACTDVEEKVLKAIYQCEFRLEEVEREIEEVAKRRRAVVERADSNRPGPPATTGGRDAISQPGLVEESLRKRSLPTLDRPNGSPRM